MDAQSNKLDIVLVDSIPLLSDCLNSLIYFNKHYNIWPSLYIDLEGVDLGRHGSISILQLFAPSMKKIYIIDVYKLQDKAFSPVDNSGISLKFILETPCIQKGIFDLRNDSDALFSHYGISIHGIHDIQLMELASRQHPRAFLAGLARCVEKESPISPEEKKSLANHKTKSPPALRPSPRRQLRDLQRASHKARHPHVLRPGRRPPPGLIQRLLPEVGCRRIPAEVLGTRDKICDQRSYPPFTEPSL
ncbi:uncharacterized protein N7529_005987 [Penicillium soppii]|uniref:uncharacterized protein n=1 Tax=Penicillium soppii TaxID=69789 RepID=UPI00254665BD|nr:uncharacterized protein N7529_005987 [Penicillium soppii]KAJ5864071.1 hypothetical protein N7529_005987 [Penicillium soppii]